MTTESDKPDPAPSEAAAGEAAPPHPATSVPAIPQPAEASATPTADVPQPAAPAPETAQLEPPAPHFFNGRSNRKRSATLSLATAGLEIVEDGMLVDVWPYASIRRADGPREVLRLRSVTALPLARVEVFDPALQAAVAARCPALDLGEEKQTWRIVGWSLAAVTSIVLLGVYVVPIVADRLVPFIPQSFERRLGEAVDKQAEAIFGGKRCTAAEGQAAFVSLVDKLKQAGGVDVPLSAAVLASHTPNAFALPGGKIFLLDGLIQKADSPDEIAGVLAHELGHVKHRDHLRQLIQTGGTSFLFGLLFGDVSGAGAVIFASRTLLNASYSREAEQNADDFAVDVMHKLGRSPKPMGDLLLRVTGAQANKSYTILASHPMTEARREAMIKADRPATGAALLSDAQWRSLKTMCGGVAAVPARPAAPARPAPPARSGQGGEEGAGRDPGLSPRGDSDSGADNGG
ncbi:MAG TPA: M48 family metallopeptidase [Pseudolabrys sp.]|nr:M48 family metallopeptidase [Pseudolabrys sp.]